MPANGKGIWDLRIAEIKSSPGKPFTFSAISHSILRKLKSNDLRVVVNKTYRKPGTATNYTVYDVTVQYTSAEATLVDISFEIRQHELKALSLENELARYTGERDEARRILKQSHNRYQATQRAIATNERVLSNLRSQLDTLKNWSASHDHLKADPQNP